MVYERFVKQLDGCSYVSGSNNCTAASTAMWLYRASQGKVVTTSCAVRRLTGDTSGGLNLRQIVPVAAHYGLTGTLWLPGDFDKLRELILTGRYGAIVQIGYSQIAGSPYDCFSGRFRGGHAVYVSRGSSYTAHEGDPGADGRRADVPDGYQNMPWALLERAAAALPLSPSGPTLGQEFGSGKVYAYLTPRDPGLVWGSDVPADVQAAFSATKVGAAIKKLSHDPGSVVNLSDITTAFKHLGVSYGTVVNIVDIEYLLKRAA